MLSATLEGIGLTESVGRTKFRFRKKTMNLCVNDSEDHEDGVGVSVKDTSLSDLSISFG